MDWTRYALAHDPGAFWDGAFFHPNRLVHTFADPFLGQALLTWPLGWWTTNPLPAFNLAFLAGPFLSAVGTYGFARALGAGPGGALLSGSLFGFAPFRYAQASHLQVESCQFLPLALWASVSALSGARFRAFAGAAAALLAQLLFGIYAAIVAAYALGSFWIWAAVSGRTRRGHLLPGAAAAAVLAAASLPVLLPYVEARGVYGLARSLHDAREGSSDLTDFVLAPERSRLWSKLPDRLRNTSHAERQFGSGWFCLASAAAAAIAFRARLRRSPAAFLPWLWLYGLVMALGPRLHVGGAEASLGRHEVLGHTWTLHVNLPGHLLFQALPGLDGMRAISRFGMACSLAAAVLSGLFLTFAWHRARGSRAARAALAAGAALAVAELYGGPLPLSRPPLSDPGEAPYRYLASRAEAGAVVELPTSAPWVDRDSPARDAWYCFRTRLHRRKLLNGYSGHSPPDYGAFQRMAMRFPDAPSLDYFRSRGARFLVLHDGVSSGPRLAPARLPRDRIVPLPLVFAGAGAFVFDLGPARRAPRRHGAAAAHPGSREVRTKAR